jgi:hypothetical protein
MTDEFNTALRRIVWAVYVLMLCGLAYSVWEMGRTARLIDALEHHLLQQDAEGDIRLRNQEAFLKNQSITLMNQESGFRILQETMKTQKAILETQQAILQSQRESQRKAEDKIRPLSMNHWTGK